jgi:hypothetical protein
LGEVKSSGRGELETKIEGVMVKRGIDYFYVKKLVGDKSLGPFG